eukprot:m.230372 g.230372  ORF g.230372 m.230372 type:complete len:214 (-) comp17353_c0_seq23:2876-3517(-)
MTSCFLPFYCPCCHTTLCSYKRVRMHLTSTSHTKNSSSLVYPMLRYWRGIIDLNNDRDTSAFLFLYKEDEAPCVASLLDIASGTSTYHLTTRAYVQDGSSKPLATSHTAIMPLMSLLWRPSLPASVVNSAPTAMPTCGRVCLTVLLLRWLLAIHAQQSARWLEHKREVIDFDDPSSFGANYPLLNPHAHPSFSRSMVEFDVSSNSFTDTKLRQ